MFTHIAEAIGWGLRHAARPRCPGATPLRRRWRRRGLRSRLLQAAEAVFGPPVDGGAVGAESHGACLGGVADALDEGARGDRELDRATGRRSSARACLRSRASP